MNIEKLENAKQLSNAITELENLIENWERATCFHPAFKVKLCDDEFNAGPVIDMVNFNECYFKKIKNDQLKELHKQLDTAKELFENL